MLSSIYHFGLKLDKKFTTSRKLPYPVISVGNVSVGGRGKTPLVVYLCRYFKEHGVEPIVLTRGYGRESSSPCWLDSYYSDVDIAGDEPTEIFYRTGSAVLIGKDRYKNAVNYIDHRKILKPIKKAVFILDDGFQHWSLQRDLDIVMVDSHDFKDKLLPLGRLREPISALKRADFILTKGIGFFKKSKIISPTLSKRDAVGVLTTRAADNTYFHKLQKDYPNSVWVKLEDHANRQKMLRAMGKHSFYQYLVGAKEAVKLLNSYKEVKEFFETGRSLIHVDDKIYELFFVDVELEFKKLAEFKEYLERFIK